MAYSNSSDQRAAVRRHYEANKDAYKARAKAFSANERVRVRAFVSEYLIGHPCVDCGKEFNIGEANSRSISLSRVKMEIEKCDVRCANCHRRRTVRQRQNGEFSNPIERGDVPLPLFDWM